MLATVKWPAFYHIWLLITYKEQLLRCALPFETGDVLFPYKYISTMHHLCFMTAKSSSKLCFSIPSSWVGFALTWWAFTRCTKEQNQSMWMEMKLLLECQSEPNKHWMLTRPVEVKRMYRCSAALIMRLCGLGSLRNW